MNLGRLNHVGIATPSIERSLELYRTMFGAEPHGAPFDLAAQGVRVCFVDTPNSQIELVPRQGWPAVATTRRSIASMPSIARDPLRNASIWAARSASP